MTIAKRRAVPPGAKDLGLTDTIERRFEAKPGTLFSCPKCELNGVDVMGKSRTVGTLGQIARYHSGVELSCCPDCGAFYSQGGALELFVGFSPVDRHDLLERNPLDERIVSAIAICSCGYSVAFVEEGIDRRPIS